MQLFDVLQEERECLISSIDDLEENELHNQCYGWNIIQVFSHLNMSEKASVLYMKKKMRAGEHMPKFSFRGKIGFFFTKRLLQSSLKWNAPKVIASPNGDFSLEEIKEQWNQTRSEMKNYIHEYPHEFINRAVYKHPFAGRLDLRCAVGSFVYHQRHHVHQVRRIRKMISK